MIYYHKPTATEYDDRSVFANKLTRCGEPWKLDLTEYDSVPVVKAELGVNQKYGTPVLEATRYYYPAVDKTAEELAQEIVDYNLTQDALRRAAYSEESDPLYLNETEHAIIDNRSPDYSAWLAKKEEIRQRYPYR